MRSLRGLARRWRREQGYTLVEMIAVLAILGFVLSALLTVFVSGTRAETDMNKRFQAEQQTRTALSTLRREIHCAYGATTTGSTLTLSFGGYCANPPVATSYQVTYCTLQLGPQHYTLYREPGAPGTCGGRVVADYLTTGWVFSIPAAVSGIMPRVGIDLPVDVAPASPVGTYELQDSITLRNGTRAT